MEYYNAAIEGLGKLLIIGLPERTIVRIQQQTLFTTKTLFLKMN